jgi:hypothetical protein
MRVVVAVGRNDLRMRLAGGLSKPAGLALAEFFDLL